MTPSCLLLVLLVAVSRVDGAALPSPTGKHSVGLKAFIWTDASRAEELSKQPADRRTISANALFPADPLTGVAGAYMPDLALWLEQVGESRIKESTGPAFPALKSVEIGIRHDAAFAKGGERFPLLVFLPGLGMNVAVYTALLAEVASHGYVVLAINPTYEVFAATIAKDKAVGFSSPGWFQAPVERIVQYERGRLLVWASDAAYAMRQLAQLSAFQKRINWRKVGALGHSAGARVAAHLCQSEPRVMACMNLDGFAGFQPFFADAGTVFERQFAMVHMALRDPTGEQLARMRMTREDMLREKARQRNAGIRVFESVRPGSVEITLSTPGIQHGSFTDLPILAAAAGDPLRAMTLTRSFCLAFFDKALKGVRKTVFDEVPPSDVLIERYTFKGPVSNP